MLDSTVLLTTGVAGADTKTLNAPEVPHSAGLNGCPSTISFEYRYSDTDQWVNPVSSGLFGSSLAFVHPLWQLSYDPADFYNTIAGGSD